MTTIDQIKSLIAAGKTEEALKFLLILTKDKDPDFERQALLLSGQYQQWERNRNLGIEESNSELRRIEFSILDILDEDSPTSTHNIKRPKIIKNESRGLASFGKDIKQSLEKEKLVFSLDTIKFSKQQNYATGFAKLTRAYEWIVDVPIIIPTNNLFVTWDAPSEKVILGVEHLLLSPKLNIDAQNSSTVSSSLWDIKTAKDAEFWSSINNTSQTMVDHKIKNDPDFKQMIYNKAIRLMNEKISDISDYSNLNIIIAGIKCYDGSIEKFNL